MSSLCLQIVANIYEPQGISFVDTRATFMTNDLLPLVEKTVTDKKVPTFTVLALLPFFWVLNTILFILSGAHQFLANYGTAEEMSGLPWNTYWRRFYHPVWCEPSKEPWRYSGQFLTWSKCGLCVDHILSFPDIPILDVSCYHGCSKLRGDPDCSHLLTKDFCFIVSMCVILFYCNFFLLPNKHCFHESVSFRLQMGILCTSLLQKTWSDSQRM